MLTSSLYLTFQMSFSAEPVETSKVLFCYYSGRELLLGICLFPALLSLPLFPLTSLSADTLNEESREDTKPNDGKLPEKVPQTPTEKNEKNSDIKLEKET